MPRSLTIGITNYKKYEDYRKWITDASLDIEVVCLSAKANNLNLVSTCDGIVLTGGEDVQPHLYNKPEYMHRLDPQEMNPERDTFEMEVIAATQKAGKPMLGICRGLQLTNVFFGGSLVPDIPTVIGEKGHGKINGQDQRHDVTLLPGSLIHRITGKQAGVVNSAHHQSADEIGESLVVSALAEMGVVEALERKEPENKPWLLLVQWHPERISDDPNFSLAIRKAFLEAVMLTKQAQFPS
ncbi:gamma-glutamyl-gamma-aminobutyrate hydrolase family protein [Parasediminibacterium sp. JCM 36343]|uniref:gamma-glutamyl-gamma-aminobutyrate hydrolase family protein n=1 Tax=Parasediminibacterium sp. JCM 36343 TaxID=3374279 RepID=UPI003978986F